MLERMDDAVPSAGNGVMMQIYLPSWGDGLKGLRERIGYLRWLGVSGVVTQPVGLYSGLDGPYSPLVDLDSMPVVADEFGGDQTLRSTNAALREAGIPPFGDLVLNHCSADSPLWRQALDGDPEAQAAFRLVTRPDEFDNKVNIFGLRPYRWVPELGLNVAQTFYDDMIDYDVAYPPLKAYLAHVINHMFDDWGYVGVRLDAIAYAGTRILETPTGEHQQAGLDLARFLRQTVFNRWPGTTSLAEAGGSRELIAPWLTGGRCQWAYDFGYGPALLASLGREDWGPLSSYLARSPLIDPDARWVLFLRSHDELQLRYSEFKDELIARHGGPDGRYVVFDGNGLNQRLAQLVPGLDAHVLAVGLTICLDGAPLVFQGDVERRVGNDDATERWPSRDPMSWEPVPPLYGWTEKPAQPFAADAQHAAVASQFTSPRSPLHRNRRWIQLRNAVPALQHGARLDLKSDTGAVMGFARITPDRGNTLVFANAADDNKTTHTDLSRWRGKRLRRLVTDPASYRLGIPDLLWDEAPWIGWDDARQYRIDLEPHELRVMIPY